MIDDDRFEELWDDYLEGDLDEAGRGELQRLLVAEPRMQRAVDAYEIHRLLGMLAAEAELPAAPAHQKPGAGPSAADAFVADTMAQLRADDAFAGDVMSRIGGLRPSVTEHAAGSQGGFARWWQAAAAAVILCSLAAVAVLFIRQRDGGVGADGPVPQVADAPAAVARGDLSQRKTPLATITQQKFLLPFDPERPLSVGQPLEPGHIKILGGAVEMTLRNGVEILLEGPGELELIDELRAVLHGGSAVVRMPKGTNGFRLCTPSTEVLDLGTEFAVKVGQDLVTDVQVYDGAVIAAVLSGNDAGRFPKRLEAGQAARFSSRSPDQAAMLAYREDRFVRRLPTDAGIEHHMGVGHAEHRVAVGSPEASAVNDFREFGRPRARSIVVTRLTGPITIDGRLDEWDSAPGVTATLDQDPSAAESMDGRMMYDDTHLYIAARVGDPHPLSSTIDPSLDADLGWRGGAVQVRLSTDRTLGWPVNASAPSYYRLRRVEPTAEQKEAAVNPRLAHLTMWFQAATAMPCLTIGYGMLTGDLQVNPSGFRGGYARAADGRGYTMEYAIPWRLLNCEDDPPQPGDDLAASWQVFFSDEGGRLWRTQIIEVRNPDEPPRIYTWERASSWGRAEYR